MNVYELIGLDPNEKPLDNIVTDGGMCGIFRTFCCIGDSLSSGEFEALDENNVRSWHDMFEYSWGSYIARACGSEVRHFARGGLTAKEFCQSFADQNDLWNPEKRSQAYIMALGVNDVINQHQPVGSIKDVDLADWHNNADTFAGYYCQILQRMREMCPEAPFFLVTMPQEGHDDELRAEHARLLYEIAQVFPYTYVIDLYRYAPKYDEAFCDRFNLHGHLNPMGYILTARMIESYIDYIIRHNPHAFRQAGFIGKPQFDPALA